MFDYVRALSVRPALDTWLDAHEMTALTALNDAVAKVLVVLDPLIAKASAGDALLRPQAFVGRDVDPVLRTIAEPIVARLVAVAATELREIVEHELGHVPSMSPPAARTGAFEGWRDVAMAAASIGAGTAAALAVPVRGGSALAGVSWARSLLSAARIKDKGVERLRARVHAHIAAILLGEGGNPPSLFEQVRATLRGAAARAEETLQ